MNAGHDMKAMYPDIKYVLPFERKTIYGRPGWICKQVGVPYLTKEVPNMCFVMVWCSPPKTLIYEEPGQIHNEKDYTWHHSWSYLEHFSDEESAKESLTKSLEDKGYIFISKERADKITIML